MPNITVVNGRGDVRTFRPIKSFDSGLHIVRAYDYARGKYKHGHYAVCTSYEYYFEHRDWDNLDKVERAIAGFEQLPLDWHLRISKYLDKDVFHIPYCYIMQNDKVASYTGYNYTINGALKKLYAVPSRYGLHIVITDQTKPKGGLAIATSRNIPLDGFSLINTTEIFCDRIILDIMTKYQISDLPSLESFLISPSPSEIKGIMYIVENIKDQLFDIFDENSEKWLSSRGYL